MIVPGSSSPLLLSPTNYNLTRSLRFRSSASAYLNRTPASAGNRKTWTFSTWVKRGKLGSSLGFISAGTNGNQIFFAGFSGTDDKIYIHNGIQGSSTASWAVTSAVFRDPSAWYHIVLAVDTTQATDTNRIKLYVNNQLQTLSSFLGSSTYPTQNYDTAFNNNVIQEIGYGYDNSSKSYFDGYLTEVNFIDGQALTPSSFGATSPATGVWQPKKYTGTYGTNGFYLPFTDNSALTSGSNAGLGKDFSGNGNYWNTNNISITSGATYDSMTDVPTLTSATASNFCTLNPLDKNTSNITLSNGNLTATVSSTNFGTRSTFAVSSGKWYWESTITTLGSGALVGIADSTWPLNYVGSTSASYGYINNGNKYNNASATAYGATFTTGDVIGIALDMDAGTLTFYKNGTSQGTAFSSLSGTFFPAISGQTSTVIDMNFGQRPFAYTPPTGFVALNTYNLPTPTVGATASTQANKYMDISLWTGDGSTTPRTITNSGGFQPDFVWVKNRTFGYDHTLYNSVRGAGNNKELGSNVDYAEGGVDGAYYGYMDSFTSSGFSLTAGSGPSPQRFYLINQSSNAYVGWQWKAGNSTVTNTAGSTSSQVRANTTTGFSIVTYAGAGGTSTVGHGLGVAPSMIIVKCYDVAGTQWRVYHSSVGSGSSLILNSTSATTTGFWNNTAPTSSVFTVAVPSGNGDTNTAGRNYVAYCFAEVAGFSKFGSYTGNGSNDGPFIYTGFRPRFVMIKRTDSTSPWLMYDTARDTYNQANQLLRPNTSQAETGSGELDLISNGFKYRGSSTNSDYVTNVSGATYIYMAFAENPFKYSLAR